MNFLQAGNTWSAKVSRSSTSTLVCDSEDLRKLGYYLLQGYE